MVAAKAKPSTPDTKPSEDDGKTVAHLGGPVGQGEGTPQDGSVRHPVVAADGKQIDDYLESNRSVHPLVEAD